MKIKRMRDGLRFEKRLLLTFCLFLLMFLLIDVIRTHIPYVEEISMIFISIQGIIALYAAVLLIWSLWLYFFRTEKTSVRQN